MILSFALALLAVLATAALLLPLVRRPAVDVSLSRAPFFFGGVACQRSQIQLVDHGCRRTPRLDQLGNASIAIRQFVFHLVAVGQQENLSQGGAAGPFALTTGHSPRPVERIEKVGAEVFV